MLEKSFEAKELSLASIFSDEYLFEIPYYQRPYAWTTDETDELLSDLIAAMDESNTIQPYFLGSIVLVKASSHPSDYQVIDGQQRLTTLTMLICALRERSSEKMGRDLETFVYQEGNLAKGTKDIFRITLRDTDRDFFREKVQMTDMFQCFMSETQEPHWTESQRRIYENCKHIDNKLSEFNSTQCDKLAQFLIPFRSDVSMKELVAV